MAEVISPMEIDNDDQSNTAPANNKGKNVVASTSGPKATPWVEKYRPQSLADVAAHRDIVETGKFASPGVEFIPSNF